VLVHNFRGCCLSRLGVSASLIEAFFGRSKCERDRVPSANVRCQGADETFERPHRHTGQCLKLAQTVSKRVDTGHAETSLGAGRRLSIAANRMQITAALIAKA